MDYSNPKSTMDFKGVCDVASLIRYATERKHRLKGKLDFTRAAQAGKIRMAVHVMLEDATWFDLWKLSSRVPEVMGVGVVVEAEEATPEEVLRLAFFELVTEYLVSG